MSIYILSSIPVSLWACTKHVSIEFALELVTISNFNTFVCVVSVVNLATQVLRLVKNSNIAVNISSIKSWIAPRY